MPYRFLCIMAMPLQRLPESDYVRIIFETFVISLLTTNSIFDILTKRLMGRSSRKAPNAMIREIAGQASGNFRGVCPVSAKVTAERLFNRRYAIGRLRKCCLGVYRHDQGQTGRKLAGLLYELE